MPVILASIAGQLLIAGLGEALARGDEAKAQEVRAQIAAKYGAQALPHFETAVAEQAKALPGEDPALRTSQMNALGALEREYQMGGNTDADKAALDLARQDVSAKSASDVGTIQQQLASRGTGGGLGGAYLSMQAAQGGTNALGRIDQQNVVDARKRALGALESGANLAGNMRGQDLGYNTAQSAIDRFNSGMRWDAQRARTQDVQRAYENEVGKDVRVGNAQQGVAQGHQQNADNTRRTFGAVAGAVGDATDAYGNRKKRGDE